MFFDQVDLNYRYDYSVAWEAVYALLVSARWQISSRGNDSLLMIHMQHSGSDWAEYPHHPINKPDRMIF